jgi:manganese/zinc/iron transport system ATP- binding protein
MTAALSIRNLSVSYQRQPAVNDISIEFPAGKLFGIIGPNGAGKSTLLKACLDLIPRQSGEILLHGKPYTTQKNKVGYVPQRESVDWDFPVSVLDVVTMGLYAEIGWFRRIRHHHQVEACQFLDKVGLADLATRQISELSGGQQQRVFLARALAQKSDVYFMDEPLAAVDARTEEAIVALLSELKTAGKTCLIVHHDLNTVRRYFDEVVLLNRTVIAAGPTAEVFTAENLRKTYGGALTFLDDLVSRPSPRPHNG